MSTSSKPQAAEPEAAHGHPKVGRSAVKGQKPPPVQLPKERYADAPKTPGPKTPADEAIDFFESTERGTTPIKVYELHLESDGGPNKERAYTRLPPAYKPYILRVTIEAGSPASRNGVFMTNFPLDGGKFSRDYFVERKLPTDFSKPIKIDLPISHAGAFVYWLEYDGPEGRIKAREGYFNIDPILSTYKRTPVIDSKTLTVAPKADFVEPREKVFIPLDGIAMLTVVSKWMGALPEWEPHFAEARARGYNMLHYTPLQQRGESNSPYSISDQLAFDRQLFEADYKGNKEDGVQRVKDILKLARKQYGLMSLTDVVLNHTANNSEWLQEHPEAGFSPFNCPHLTPALELDDCIIEFSTDLASRGLPTLVKTQDDIDTLTKALKEDIAKLNLWQYYVLNVEREKSAVAKALSESRITPWTGPDIQGKPVGEIADIVRGAGKLEHVGRFAERFQITVDPAVAAGIVKSAFSNLDNASPEGYGEAWGRIADVLNVNQYKEWEEDTKVALENIVNRVKYTRLDDHGPKIGEITRTMPLVDTYFTRIPKNATTAKHDPRALAVANNGWIWAADPLANFALPPSKAYLRREVIVWGDCVKLRYGDGPDDNPWLWKHMTEYVESLAAIFDGFRIDNCHSTPLHVGVALLDAARAVNPDLYVCAELFTGSQEMDVHFVSRLGINSLIREAMNGGNPQHLSGILYEYGLGKPIGSMDESCLTSYEELPPPTGKGATRPAAIVPLRGSKPHALMYDVTHDNESPLHKRSAEDALSTGALVTFGCFATGSNKGFDDLYPKLLDLVGDNRKYETSDGGKIYRGISKVKKVLNQLHTEMVLGGFKEGHVHQEGDYIAIHRVQPKTQKGYFLIAHTAFSKGSKARGTVGPISLKSTKARFVLGASIDIPSYEINPSPTTITGLPSTLKELAEVPPKETSDGCELIVPEEFPPGSILLYETQLVGVDPELEETSAARASEAFAELDLVDLNVVLHRCDGEEKDATGGEIGTYNIGGLGNLTYCGLEGWMHPLRHIMNNNDLGHPLCENLRQGDWALGYVESRLEKQIPTFPRLAKPVAWFKSRFDLIRAQAPPFLRPKYFAIVIFSAYKAARRVAIEQCSDFIVSGHEFTRDLALTQVQMHGLVQSASIDPGKVVPSLAAGLPHFTSGWARTWGRDVFISLRGLFLTTGNYAAARAHILAFCATLKHGLIPNLLDALRTPRYNSRDSPWWMVQNIQDYCSMAPEGLALLEVPVKRRFPKDDTFVPWDDPRAYAYSSTVAEIIQEILQRHASGISFREHNAGPNLDMQMSDEGFQIDVKVDWETGFTLGGNWRNCGTWMDKMGESQKAGTKGTPGTPRDGAPVEITGLLFSTLRWLDGLSQKGKFPFKGVDAVVDGQAKFVTYREWATLIQNAFERYYYVPANPVEDPDYMVDPRIINQRGIYKDVYGSGAGREWSDYQLRCNFPIAMVVAPELFNPEHALGALKIADKRLRGPLGMKTLDEADSQYRGYYDNSNDSDDGSIAKGLNYHQGPEWGWPLGYFLRAYLKFDLLVGTGKKDPSETLHRLHEALLPARHHIASDPWAGIPELTNRNGEYCRDSCNTQAWSSSCLLDFLEDVHKLQHKA